MAMLAQGSDLPAEEEARLHPLDQDNPKKLLKAAEEALRNGDTGKSIALVDAAERDGGNAWHVRLVRSEANSAKAWEEADDSTLLRDVSSCISEAATVVTEAAELGSPRWIVRAVQSFFSGAKGWAEALVDGGISTVSQSLVGKLGESVGPQGHLYAANVLHAQAVALLSGKNDLQNAQKAAEQGLSKLPQDLRMSPETTGMKSPNECKKSLESILKYLTKSSGGKSHAGGQKGKQQHQQNEVERRDESKIISDARELLTGAHQTQVQGVLSSLRAAEAFNQAVGAAECAAALAVRMDPRESDKWQGDAWVESARRAGATSGLSGAMASLAEGAVKVKEALHEANGSALFKLAKRLQQGSERLREALTALERVEEPLHAQAAACLLWDASLGLARAPERGAGAFSEAFRSVVPGLRRLDNFLRLQVITARPLLRVKARLELAWTLADKGETARAWSMGLEANAFRPPSNTLEGKRASLLIGSMQHDSFRIACRADGWLREGVVAGTERSARKAFLAAQNELDVKWPATEEGGEMEALTASRLAEALEGMGELDRAYRLAKRASESGLLKGGHLSEAWKRAGRARAKMALEAERARQEGAVRLEEGQSGEVERPESLRQEALELFASAISVGVETGNEVCASLVRSAAACVYTMVIRRAEREEIVQNLFGKLVEMALSMPPAHAATEEGAALAVSLATEGERVASRGQAGKEQAARALDFAEKSRDALGSKAPQALEPAVSRLAAALGKQLSGKGKLTLSSVAEEANAEGIGTEERRSLARQAAQAEGEGTPEAAWKASRAALQAGDPGGAAEIGRKIGGALGQLIRAESLLHVGNSGALENACELASLAAEGIQGKEAKSRACAVAVNAASGLQDARQVALTSLVRLAYPQAGGSEAAARGALAAAQAARGEKGVRLLTEALKHVPIQSLGPLVRLRAALYAEMGAEGKALQELERVRARGETELLAHAARDVMEAAEGANCPRLAFSALLVQRTP